MSEGERKAGWRTGHAGNGVRSRLGRLAVAITGAALAACWLPAVGSATPPAGATPAPAGGTPYAMGLIPTPSPAVSAAPAPVRATVAALPDSVDLTAYAMPVGNQGDVGSCAAWAADYAALGYWVNKQGIPGGPLAPMYTYSQNVVGNDQGSSIEGNLNTDERGIDNQSDYWQGNYDWTDVPSSAETDHAVNWKLTGFTGLPLGDNDADPPITQDSIETALAAGEPVVIGMSVYNNFFSVNAEDVTGDDHGFYAGPAGSAFAGYHAVTALGYDSAGLRVENSWGAGWGDAGYATLSWSYVNQYVFDAVAIGPLTVGQPVSSGAPAITGAAQQGVALSASTGSWNPTASSYGYQWERAATGSNRWAEIAGATGAEYVPGAADVGQSLRVLVTAANGQGHGAASSAATAAVASGAPASQAPPSISGTAAVGQTLTASPGAWSAGANVSGYQWQRSADGSSWSNVTGATGTSYVPVAADVNAYLRALVTATNAAGVGTAASARVGPVPGPPPIAVGPAPAPLAAAPAPPPAPVEATAPAISGSPARGAILTASRGKWSPAGVSYAYQWQRSSNAGRSWVKIAGATGPSYTLAIADEKSQVRVIVTAINPYGQAGAASAATGPVKASPPDDATPPTVSGTAQSGDKLRAAPGSWGGAGNSFGYQWQRKSGSGFVNIAGAKGQTYLVTQADAGAAVRVVVTATNPDASVNRASAATKPVALAPSAGATKPVAGAPHAAATKPLAGTPPAAATVVKVEPISRPKKADGKRRR